MGVEDYRDYQAGWGAPPPVSPFSWDVQIGDGRGGAVSWAPDRFAFNGEGFGPTDWRERRQTSDSWLPPGVPGLLDAVPPSRWTDLQCVDRLDRSGNLIRQFADGNRVIIAGNPPERVLIVNPTTTKEIALDPYGNIVQAVEINNRNGSVRARNDCIGGIVDGYGAIHGVNGRVERRNGLISPNERAYVYGLEYGFPERRAVNQGQHNHRFDQDPCYQQNPAREWQQFYRQLQQQLYQRQWQPFQRQQYYPPQFYQDQFYEQQFYPHQRQWQQVYPNQRQQFYEQQLYQQQHCMNQQRFLPQQQILPQMLMQLLARQGMQFMRHSPHHNQHQFRVPRGRCRR